MVKVKVPATSANMGSGFDSIGIALTLYNDIYLEESDRLEISCDTDQTVPQDESNMIYQCAKKVYDICGVPMKGMKIVEHCDIPQTRGLGSSSACTVAGIMGANALLKNPLSRENMIDLAASLEGHPDNTTPAIMGGFVAALMEYDKVWCVRVPICGRLDFVAFIPDFELKTESARAALPTHIPFSDAIYNLSRAALLSGSLVTGDLQNIGVAIGDRLHQPYRFPLIPEGKEMLETAKGLGALGSYISGAGPAVIAIVPSDDKTYLARATNHCRHRFLHWTPMLLRCDEQGATVEEV